jgi:hypothetical protein
VSGTGFQEAEIVVMTHGLMHAVMEVFMVPSLRMMISDVVGVTEDVMIVTVDQRIAVVIEIIETRTASLPAEVIVEMVNERTDDLDPLLLKFEGGKRKFSGNV